MNKLSLINEHNGLCRVYYRDPDCNRLLCYQQGGGADFSLYECSNDGEPSHSIDYSSRIMFTPLPLGETEIGIDLRKWLVRKVVSNEVLRVNDYLLRHEGFPSEEDMSINDLSRDVIRKIHNVYGRCYLVKINRSAAERMGSGSIATQYEEGDRWNGHNFCADFVVPVVSSGLVGLVEKWAELSCISVLNEINHEVESLGGQTLVWV